MPILLKEPRLFIEETDAELRILGVRVLLEQESLIPDKNLFVNAYEVGIAEDLVAPGRSVTIVTRRLKVPRPTILDVRGRAGKSQLLPARAGQIPGAKGADGAPGGEGGAGGDVRIFAEEILGQLTVRADGGAGGAGQNGGNGAVGAAGASGRDAKPSCGGPRETPGGPGGRGGQAGSGGDGGRGGDAGTVEIRVLEEPSPLPEIGAVGGVGGAAGRPGQPGRGGPGGPGGRTRSEEREPGGRFG